MLLENLTAHPRLAVVWSLTMSTDNFMIEFVSKLAIFLPPCTYRIHIVSRSSTYRKIWIPCRISECLSHRLRHSLYLEREDTEFGHYIRNTCRNHSEVLAACEHSGRVKKSRKLLHGRLLPELVVTTIEEIIVELLISAATVSIKRAI